MFGKIIFLQSKYFFVIASSIMNFLCISCRVAVTGFARNLNIYFLKKRKKKRDKHGEILVASYSYTQMAKDVDTFIISYHLSLFFFHIFLPKQNEIV